MEEGGHLTAGDLGFRTVRGGAAALGDARGREAVDVALVGVARIVAEVVGRGGGQVEGPGEERRHLVAFDGRCGAEQPGATAARDPRRGEPVDVPLEGRAVVISEVVGRRAGQVEGPVEEGRHLPPGHRVVGTEEPSAAAGRDPRVGEPDDVGPEGRRAEVVKVVVPTGRVDGEVRLRASLSHDADRGRPGIRQHDLERGTAACRDGVGIRVAPVRVGHVPDVVIEGEGDLGELHAERGPVPDGPRIVAIAISIRIGDAQLDIQNPLGPIGDRVALANRDPHRVRIGRGCIEPPERRRHARCNLVDVRIRAEATHDIAHRVLDGDANLDILLSCCHPVVDFASHNEVAVRVNPPRARHEIDRAGGG